MVSRNPVADLTSNSVCTLHGVGIQQPNKQIKLSLKINHNIFSLPDPQHRISSSVIPKKNHTYKYLTLCPVQLAVLVKLVDQLVVNHAAGKLLVVQNRPLVVVAAESWGDPHHYVTRCTAEIIAGLLG